MHLLAHKISDFILNDRGAGEDPDFNSLGLQLFEYQYANIQPYRLLCDAEGARPGGVASWREIPPVPAAAFKEFDLSCAPIDNVAVTFHSSGTTGEMTSRHHMDADALSLYDVNLRRGFDRVFGPARDRLLWALMPPKSLAPHSSLSYMLESLGADRFFWDNLPELQHALRTVDKPVILFGTAFAFVQLFDSIDEQWALPPQSVIIETGGFKGRVAEVSREDLYGLLARRLGISPDNCYSEYGMSEMASQFYGRGLDPVKRAPHWVRTRVIDPRTGNDAAPGASGVLRHYDLANFNSSFGLETEDYGYRSSDGFILLGRLESAEVRGCSLTVEELTRKLN